TVLRGIAGFGANSRIHTTMILRLSEDLPIVLEWVDTAERVARVLPRLQAMAADGMITVEDVEVVHYRHRVDEHVWGRLRVREVMTRAVDILHSETPLLHAVETLVRGGHRAAPVVDASGRVVGIVTNGDIVERGGLGLRVDLLGRSGGVEVAGALTDLARDKMVADVMTRDVVSIAPEATLADAAHLMVTRRLKRLPVVGPNGALLGLISRVDLLRTSAEFYAAPSAEPALRWGATVVDAMRVDVPTVRWEAPLIDVLDAVMATRLNLALVLDDERRVVGLVGDAEVLRRLSPRDRPPVLRVLMERLALGSASPADRSDLERAQGNTAGTLMRAPVPTVSPDTSFAEAVAVMVREHLKLLPVVDAQGRLLGAADRADLLRLLATRGGPRGDSVDR
ncbi:MAG: DUF190 domain-containing protein, partial [Chloroflexota bacterium]